ncbi:MAG: tRNA pseudouridine38-40 synthase TruA [Bacteroidetes bacterium HLUCCA01]|nr:MAG: tRNA pseudouridine38-40 synthase TruA [Bacteroidetes bacterium HLUCCA01]
MPRLVFEIRYDGSGYAGWQKQSGNLPTVQGDIERALSILARTPVTITGAGRTDKGVHASQTFFHADIPRETVLSAGFARSMRGLLGNDIQLNAVYEVSSDFHARFDALSRTYQYFFSFKPDVFKKNYEWQIRQKLCNPDAMIKTARAFNGDHDFACYSKYNPDVAHTRCVIVHSKIQKIDAMSFTFEITANRFLHSMVRMLTGALVKLGTGMWSEEYVLQKLHKPQSDKTSFSAPAHGLFLKEVHYDQARWVQLL